MAFPIDIAQHLPLILLLAGVVVVSAVARRIPVLGTLINIVVLLALVTTLALILVQRERFDPYLSRILATLDLTEQKVVGGETRIRMAPDGHFWADVRFAGVERRMLIDSGATVTALSVDTAAAADLPIRDALFPVLLNTANGTVRAQTSAVPELRLGNVVARDVPVVVSPAFGRTDVLGMNFLSRLKSWRVEGRTLILEPHHPTETTS